MGPKSVLTRNSDEDGVVLGAAHHVAELQDSRHDEVSGDVALRCCLDAFRLEKGLPGAVKFDAARC